jgi:hypothetical protein
MITKMVKTDCTDMTKRGGDGRTGQDKAREGKRWNNTLSLKKRRAEDKKTGRRGDWEIVKIPKSPKCLNFNKYLNTKIPKRLKT